MGGIIAQILTAHGAIGVSMAVCVAITFFYIILMHYCAFWLSWISVGLIQVSLVTTGYVAFTYRRQ